MYIRELEVRYRTRRIADTRLPTHRLCSPQDAIDAFLPILRDEVVEVCGLFCISIRNHVLAYHELSRGTVDTTVIHPRDVFKVALLANASGVLVAHNHPSGDPSPSASDIAITRRLQNAGELMGIELIDHIIVAADQCVSLRSIGSFDQRRASPKEEHEE